ncbi:MAG: hypothetical protein CNLJKLNK_00997 [Holosporales bacterium]
MNTKLSPLCVDLDGTLIYEDVIWVSWKNLIKSNPKKIFMPAFWFLKGRAYMKHQLAIYSFIDPAQLTYNQALLDFLKKCKEDGVRIILATAADEKFARIISNYLGVFDTVIASDEKNNRRADVKADTLCAYYGEKNFSYVGNSYDDLKVWRRAKFAICTNLSFKARLFLWINPQSFLDVGLPD